MPRNPNSPRNPGCGPVHTHTSASENIKLQMMMTKLEESLRDELKSISNIEKTNTENLIDTYTITYSDGTSSTFTVTNGQNGENGQNGQNGREVKFNVNDTHIQWGYADASGTVAEDDWEDLIALISLKGDKGDDGDSGRKVELQVTETAIQWKYDNEKTWTDLIYLDQLKGAQGNKGDKGNDGATPIKGKDYFDGKDGREIKLQTDDTYIQWKYDTDTTWTNLIELNSLKIKGDTGESGVGIKSITKTLSENLVDTYEITYTDATKTPFTFTVTNGTKGDTGDPGQSAYDLAVAKGFKGTEVEWLASLKGSDGNDGRDVVITIKNNNLVWYYTGEEDNYQVITTLAALKGDPGEQGIQGPQGDAFTYEDFTDSQLAALKVKGDKGDKGDAFTFEDFTPEQLDSLKVKGDKGDTGSQGPQGEQGPKGADGRGISNILPLDRVGLINTYSIYYTDGTVNTFTVTDGKDGEQGPQGVGIVDIVHDRDDIDGNCVYKIYLSDNTTREFTAYKGNDGAAPSIKVGDLVYAPVDNIVTLPNFITEIPAEYITESELDSKGYLTEHQSLENYATKVYVTEAVTKAVTDGKVDLDGYATETYVDEAVSKIEIPDVSKFITEIPAEYVTETELNNKGYLIERDLGDYAKKTDLFSKSYNDLTDKPAIPSIEGLATEDYVDNTIAAIDIPETDLTNYYDKEEVEGLIESIEHPKQTYYLDFTSTVPKKPETLTDEIKEAATQIIAGNPVAIYLRDDKVADSYLNNYGAGTIKLIESDTYYQIDFGRIARSHTVVGGITANWDYTYSLLCSKTNSSFFQYTATASKQEFVTQSYVTTAIKAIPANPKKVSELENDKGYITLSEVPETDLSNYYTKDETYTKSEVDALLPAVEQVKQAVLNEVSPEVESVKTTVQSELLPKIEEEIEPTVSELKTWVENKEYLQDIDLEGYATLTDLASKADNIPFKTDAYVTNPIGLFSAGESVKGLSVAEILAKLLGLSDEPVTPEEPEIPQGIVGTIMSNKTPMYQIDANDTLQEVPYTLITYQSPADGINDGQTGFYQVVDAENNRVEAGYQHYSTPKEPWYIVALPEVLNLYEGGNTLAYSWSTLENKWVQTDPLTLTNDYAAIKAEYDSIGIEAPVAPEGYQLWADLSRSDPGELYRFIIKE